MKYFWFSLLMVPVFALNYSENISPIIYNNCTNCHREGKIGAFLPLTNYDEVFNDRFWIAYAIAGDEDSRHGDPIMPPWPADRSYSNLLDEMYISDAQNNDPYNASYQDFDAKSAGVFFGLGRRFNLSAQFTF